MYFSITAVVQMHGRRPDVSGAFPVCLHASLCILAAQESASCAGVACQLRTMCKVRQDVLLAGAHE